MPHKDNKNKNKEVSSTEDKMTNSELVALLEDSIDNSILNDTSFIDANEKLEEQTYSMPYGDEEDGFSQTVTTEMSDTVEDYNVSITEIFQGEDNIFKFAPRSSRPEDVEEAEEKSIMCNYVVEDQEDSYKLINDWNKSTLINKGSVLKAYIEDTTKTEEVIEEGITESEVLGLLESLKTETVKSVEVSSKTPLRLGLPPEAMAGISEMLTAKKTAEVGEEEDITENTDDELLEFGNSINGQEFDGGVLELPEPVFDITFKVIREERKVVLINIPLENFIISNGCTSKNTAEVVGDSVTKTRGELLSEGHPRELVDRLKVNKKTNKGDSLKSTRLRAADISDTLAEDSTINNWASEEVEVMDLYVKIDYDNDGVAERRHIMMSGGEILINEAFDLVPYAINTAFPIPFSIFGRSVAELAQRGQRVNTCLVRGALDNITDVNNTGFMINDNVEYDDILDFKKNRVIRIDSDKPVNQDMTPVITEYTADRMLMVKQHMDAMRSNSTGQQMANQGLDRDAISKETATRFEGVQEMGAGKVKVVARNMAETGYRHLGEIIVWLLSRYQNTELEVFVLNKEMTINPNNWKFDHKCKIKNVNEDKETENLFNLYQLQKEVILNGSAATDEVKASNTLKRITKSLGFADPAEFWNDIEKPVETLQAENTQMQQQLQQLAAQVEQLSNPLAEAEMVKREGDIKIANDKLLLEVAKLEENQRQFDIKIQEEKDKNDDTVAIAIMNADKGNG